MAWMRGLLASTGELFDVASLSDRLDRCPDSLDRQPLPVGALRRETDGPSQVRGSGISFSKASSPTESDPSHRSRGSSVKLDSDTASETTRSKSWTQPV